MPVYGVLLVSAIGHIFRIQSTFSEFRLSTHYIVMMEIWAKFSEFRLSTHHIFMMEIWAKISEFRLSTHCIFMMEIWANYGSWRPFAAGIEGVDYPCNHPWWKCNRARKTIRLAREWVQDIFWVCSGRRNSVRCSSFLNENDLFLADFGRSWIFFLLLFLVRRVVCMVAAWI